MVVPKLLRFGHPPVRVSSLGSQWGGGQGYLARPKRTRSDWPCPGGSVESRCEPAAIGRCERVLLAQLLEDRDHQLAEAVTALGVGRLHLVEEPLERTLVVAGLESLDQLGLVPGLAQLLEQPLAGRGAGQPVQELRHTRCGLRADELAHDLAVPERLDR